MDLTTDLDLTDIRRAHLERLATLENDRVELERQAAELTDAYRANDELLVARVRAALGELAPGRPASITVRLPGGEHTFTGLVRFGTIAGWVDDYRFDHDDVVRIAQR